MLTYADLCWLMPAYANLCWLVPTYARLCRVRLLLAIFLIVLLEMETSPKIMFSFLLRENIFTATSRIQQLRKNHRRCHNFRRCGSGRSIYYRSHHGAARWDRSYPKLLRRKERLMCFGSVCWIGREENAMGQTAGSAPNLGYWTKRGIMKIWKPRKKEKHTSVIKLFTIYFTRGQYTQSNWVYESYVAAVPMNN